jgi:N-acyl homoserine lactone hydrolase
MKSRITRREFLKHSVTVGALAWTAPMIADSRASTFHALALPRIRPIPLMRFGGSSLGSSTDLAVYVWYIEGTNNRIIVDAGMDETAGWGGSKLSSLDDGLAKVGLKPEDVDMVIFTHLHTDHTHLVKRYTNAKLIVQSTELDHAPQALDFETVSGDQQIDDNVRVLLTPGHTPGGQSVLVETAAGKAIITGFCCTMEHFGPVITPPPILTNRDQLMDSMRRVKETADILVPIHDYSFADVEAIPAESATALDYRGASATLWGRLKGGL